MARSHSPGVWLNLVCLDAPVVAVAWQWLFATTFHVPMQFGNSAALLLTAWLIYLADRLADASSLNPDGPRSLRQEFCLKHRRVWMGALMAVAAAAASAIWRNTAPVTFLVGAGVGSLALVYLVLNHPLGRIWRLLPLKEISIGVLFTAGTLVALLPAVPPMGPALLSAAIAFACLCALNCISIAGWERELDEAQQKISIATRYPALGRVLGKISSALALGAFGAALFYRDTAMVFGCIGLSALLLALLDMLPATIGTDRRTALADLVLLTPLLALLITNA